MYRVVNECNWRVLDSSENASTPASVYICNITQHNAWTDHYTS